jgi:hypothetical protein
MCNAISRTTIEGDHTHAPFEGCLSQITHDLGIFATLNLKF